MQSAWNPSLATGVDQVDREHQEIFRQTALLNQAMSEGKGSQEIKNIIDFVDEYIISHFVHEESLMEKYNCPAADANKQAHNLFIAKFKGLKNKFNTNGSSITLVLEISSTINDWLIQHIGAIDTQLGACVKGPALSRST
jgi:hemerythrin